MKPSRTTNRALSGLPTVARRTAKLAKQHPKTTLVIGGAVTALAAAIATGWLKPAIVWHKGLPSAALLFSIGGGHYLIGRAAANLIAMRRAAARDGVTLNVYSSYRSFAKQALLYAQWLKDGRPPVRETAPPGFSNHNGAEAVDIKVDDPRVFAWLVVNAKRFGFYNYPAERHHWSLTGD